MEELSVVDYLGLDPVVPEAIRFWCSLGTEGDATKAKQHVVAVMEFLHKNGIMQDSAYVHEAAKMYWIPRHLEVLMEVGFFRSIPQEDAEELLLAAPYCVLEDMRSWKSWTTVRSSFVRHKDIRVFKLLEGGPMPEPQELKIYANAIASSSKKIVYVKEVLGWPLREAEPEFLHVTALGFGPNTTNAVFAALWFLGCNPLSLSSAKQTARHVALRDDVEHLLGFAEERTREQIRRASYERRREASLVCTKYKIPADAMRVIGEYLGVEDEGDWRPLDTVDAMHAEAFLRRNWRGRRVTTLDPCMLAKLGITSVRVGEDIELSQSGPKRPRRFF